MVPALSAGAYFAKEDTREIVDIKKLNAQISEIVSRPQELRSAIDEIIEDRYRGGK